MPRVNGVFTLVPSYRAISGQNIRVENHNPPLEDIALALTNSLPRDGSAGMQGNLPMSGNKITGMKAGTSAGDAVRFDQVTPYSAFLKAMAEFSNVPANSIFYATQPNVPGLMSSTSFGRGLMTLNNALDARNRLELGTLSTLSAVSNAQISGPIDINKGGTGATTAAAARSGLGLGSMAVRNDVRDADLTGAVSVSKGGTGGTTQATGRIGLGLDVSAILGLLNTAITHSDAAWRNGTVTTPGLPSPAQVRYSADIAADAVAIGVGQSWSNQIASRNVGTSYRNTTGKPIMVSAAGSGITFQVSANGSTGWVQVGVPVNDSRQMQSFIVPNQHYYRGIGGSIDVWSELR